MLDTSLLSYIYPRWLCDYQYIAAGDAKVANTFVNSYIADFFWTSFLCAYYMSAALLVRLSVVSKTVFKVKRVSNWFILGTGAFCILGTFVVSYVYYPLAGSDNCTIFNPLYSLSESTVIRQSSNTGLAFSSIVVSFYYLLVSISHRRHSSLEDSSVSMKS